jgi:hypothetical protein
MSHCIHQLMTYKYVATHSERGYECTDMDACAVKFPKHAALPKAPLQTVAINQHSQATFVQRDG